MMRWEAELTHKRFGWTLELHEVWHGPQPENGLRPVAVEMVYYSPWFPTRSWAERAARRQLAKLNGPDKTVRVVVR